MPFSPQSIEHTEARINTMRLQAAAPELLEALKNALNVMAAVATGELETIGRSSPAIAKARKAIAKATGE